MTMTKEQPKEKVADRRKRLQYFRSWRKKNAQRIREYNNTREPWVWTTKQRFSQMIYHAKKRNFAATLTFEDYEKLIKLPCYLCGEPVISAHGGHGIDRLDNSVGYILSNCRSCCGVCNVMKGDLSIIDFIIRIKKIIQNYKKAEVKQ